MKQPSNNSLPFDNSLSPYAKEIATSHISPKSNASDSTTSSETEKQASHTEEYKVNSIVSKEESWKEDWFGNYE